MGGSNENQTRITSNIQEGLKASHGGQKRKPLGKIDKNIMEGPPHSSAVHKRGVLKERTKNALLPVHRPITRKFAAQLASKERRKPFEEVKKSTKRPTTYRSSGHSITNVEDDHDILMYEQHMESMLEEIDRMDAEIEMGGRDSDEAMVDIDSGDKNNPLSVTEYIDDLYAYYKETESSSCVPPDYMDQQSDINDKMRAILIDWLIEVHYKFELIDETLYLTVNLIDRFLAVQPIERKKLQLVGVTAMLLACKYEEVSVPVVDDFITISDNAYCREEVRDMEKLMLNTLQFNMSLPTPYVFMRRFLKAAQSDKTLEMLSFYIIELSFIEYEMLQFKPSLLAAAAIFTAQCSLQGSKQWSKTCERHTSYSEDQLTECARLMAGLHRDDGSGKLVGVYKKYSTSKYGYAARKEAAAVFLMMQG